MARADVGTAQTAPEPHAAIESPPWWGLGTMPFALLLAAIAFLPLIRATSHWWDRNRNRLLVSLALSTAAVAYMLPAIGLHATTGQVMHALLDEYLPFMTLLFSLYVISGGINLSGDLRARPITNTAFLAIGALSASFIGTTGASMVLIRPLLQTNRERTHVTHTVVFFIFLVSNIGGCLLPTGDPPLFLGYLRNVPFLWTLGLWKEWAFCCGLLLAVYYALDSRLYKSETRSAIQRDDRQVQPLRLTGSFNLLLLAAVVLCMWRIVPGRPLPLLGIVAPVFMREAVLLVLAGVSLWLTPDRVHKANAFNYHAIMEVAAIFIGIFITMQVPIMVLQAAGETPALTDPWQFFWATGSLSSFLDNAPTYVVFFEAANSMTHAPGPGILLLNNGNYMREDLLVAISLGAVFMGANTYIGNGPNFMVRSIAQQAGVPMPSLFGYVFKYTLPILVPLFVLVTLVFLR